MSSNALRSNEERREFRRVSDAIALKFHPKDSANDAGAANESEYSQEPLADYPTHVVSLSPNGLKCFHTEAFEVGDRIDISMVLFPSKLRIDTTTTVVNAGEEPKDNKSNRFFAGLAFDKMTDEQVEQLLEHIGQVAKQSFGGTVKLVN